MPQRITGVLMEMETSFRSGFPEIPIAETVLSELNDPDPVFLTLPIGKVGAESRNGRKYPRESVEAVVKSINDNKVIGQKGHLRDDERAYRFDVPPLMWLSASLESDGMAWGKAYVLQSAADVRELVKLSKIAKAKIGTSIYGTADVDDDGTVRNLEIESIDLAHPGRLGVPLVGAVPVVTKEIVEPIKEAEPGELAVGDWVSWEDDGRLVRGRINTIWTEGEVEVPNSDAPAIQASADKPVARMDVYESGSEGWQSWGNQVVRYVADLTKIEPLPMKETSRTEDNPVSENGEDMKTIQELEDKIAEMERQHKDAVRVLNTQLSENREKLADYDKVSELLGKPQDVIVSLQALQIEVKDLKRENGELLQESIKAQVADTIKVEAVRPVIEQMLRDRKPARRVDVQTALAEVCQLDYVKTLLKLSVAEQMGPNQPDHSPTQTETADPVIYIPGVN